MKSKQASYLDEMSNFEGEGGRRVDEKIGIINGKCCE
jgi:hypothetical protein